VGNRVTGHLQRQQDQVDTPARFSDPRESADMASRRHQPRESSLLAPQPDSRISVPLPCLARLLTGRLRRAGKALFRAEDSRARAHSWQIQVSRGGLSRTYRDPRFDRLTRRPDREDAGPGRVADDAWASPALDVSRSADLQTQAFGGH
jgi:hypothetical protein